MKRAMRSWPGLILTLAFGLIACAGNPSTTPKLGPPFIDESHDPEASQRRYAEFFVVCIAPTRKAKPEPPMAPAWCQWTRAADKSIRENNALPRD